MTQPTPHPEHADTLEQTVSTPNGMRPARWILAPRDTFDWTADPTRQGQQKRRLHLLRDSRPVGHAIAIEARTICACGDNGPWRTNQLDVTADAEHHARQHSSPPSRPQQSEQSHTTGATS